MSDIMKSLIGLYEKALPARLSWEERLQKAREAGYDFIEISIDETDERLSRMCWTTDEKLDLIRAMMKTGMPILTMCLSGNRRYPIGSENKATRETGIQLIKDAVKFSVDIGNRVVQLAGYDEFYNNSNENTRKLFKESLRECVDFSSKYEVMLAFETMETDLMDSVAKAMAYVREINSPWLSVYPDIGNLSSRKLSVEDDFVKGAGHIVAIHLKDTRVNMVRNIPFGDGIVDFVSFFRLLRSMHYAGPFVVEMWTDESDASISWAAEARQYIIDKMEASI